jgi:hypothetical protein
MRPILIAAILALGLLAAPLALAAKGAHEAAAGRDDAKADSSARGNDTTAERHGGFQAFLAALKDVREGCRDDAVDHANMTHAEQRSWAHCIRDGYRHVLDAIHWRHHEAKASRVEARAARNG